MRVLSLLIPGLLGPFPGHDRALLPAPAAPALERLLSYGRRRAVPAAGFESELCALFGIDAEDPADLPVAALTYLGDTATPAPGWWLRMDPVHLRADQQHLLLFDAAALEITAAEARALTHGLAGLYADLGWRFEAPVAGRWYVGLAEPPRARFTPLPAVVGRPVDRYLPTGENAAQWHRLLNEAQMWLHGHELNTAREMHGRPPINSVWPWGAGRLPHGVRAPWRALWSDAALGTGLGRLADIPVAAPPEAPVLLEALPGEASGLVLEGLREASLYGDIEAWAQEVARLEARWFAPLLGALRDGRLDAIELHGADGAVHRVGR
ncbi:MAG: hypothetical protein GWO02_01620, partial [Gammaproteobacteria bacterium]|nr:hypothetical protein [Gammaproteobacteria bacterium]